MPPTSAGIYGGGPLYKKGTGPVDDVRASGFTTVVVFTIHVLANGDLNVNLEQLVASGGKYVGGSGFAGQMQRLKQAPTSVDRLIFCVGSSVPAAWQNLKALIASVGTGPGTALYQNFAALKQAIPAIDAIDFDDEQTYDPNTTVPFAQMLGAIGYEVTFCPYASWEMDFWVDCLAAVEKTNPGLVTAFNLQCYAGGDGNDPADWINKVQKRMGPGYDAGGLVVPGLWCRHWDDDTQTWQGDCPGPVQKQFGTWKSDGIAGGFIWLLDDIYTYEQSGQCSGPMGTAAYAKAVLTGI